VRNREFRRNESITKKEPWDTLLDAGCGPAPMITLLSEKYPDRHYTGIDLTPKMIEQARKKNTVSTRLSVPTAFITIRIHRTFLTAYRKS